MLRIRKWCTWAQVTWLSANIQWDEDFSFLQWLRPTAWANSWHREKLKSLKDSSEHNERAAVLSI